MGEGEKGFTEEQQAPPKFIREFSKENSGSERSVLAQELQKRLSDTRKLLEEAGELTPEIARQKAEIKNKIDRFYYRERDKWAEAPYDKEEIKKQFTEENLKSLSTEDYILLMRRFPSEMVTNVVLQGVRDHPGIEGRIAGVFSDGFKQILADGKLRSPFGKYLKEGFKKEAVAKCLGLEVAESKTDALETLETYTDPRAQGWSTYSDFIATHFAAEEVADSYYGAEACNEIFLAFPAAFIAANYLFNTKPTGTFERGGGNHNDLWTWEENGTGGVNLDVGILFVPAEARVDRKTGSRYQLDHDQKPMLDIDKIALVKRFVESDKFEEFRLSAQKLSDENKNGGSVEEILRKTLLEVGIVDSRLQNALLFPVWQIPGAVNLRDLAWEKTNPEIESVDAGGDLATGTLHGMEKKIEDFLTANGMTYKEAENTISSREYWEKYFNEHPDQKIKRVIYYQGNDPTKALQDWKESNELTKKLEEPYFGFKEHVVETYKDPRIIPGMDRFRNIGLNVIEERFPEPREKSKPHHTKG